MQEARELIARRRRNSVCSPSSITAAGTATISIRQVIEQGTLGAVKHFESHFDRFRPEVRVRWREQNVPGSGLWFDPGPHLIDRGAAAIWFAAVGAR